MKKTLTLFAVAASVLAVSCVKENPAPEAQDGKTIQLTLEATRGEADTKTAMSLDEGYHSLQSVWAAGDKIYVYSRSSGEQLGILNIDELSIVNQKPSATSQYYASFAAFTGSITLGVGDALTDTFAFVYQGAGRSIVASEGLLSYDLSTSATVAGLNAWDVAYATGVLGGTEESSVSCSVTFNNKIAFGYFTTTPVASESGIDVNYYSGFTLNVKTGAINGASGTVTIPGNAAFYMPLIPGSVNMVGTDKVWDTASSPIRYGAIQQQNPFGATAGYYYRLGKAGSYGPVPFQASGWINYETLKDKTFKVAESPDKFVHFTQGNLQWISTDAGDATDGYWKIADSQYSHLGTGNVQETVVHEGNTVLKAGNVDLFGWGEETPPFLADSDFTLYEPDLHTAGNKLTEDWATKFNSGSSTLYADYNYSPKVEYPSRGETYCVLTKNEWWGLFRYQYWALATVRLTSGGEIKGIVICPNGVDESTAIGYGFTTVHISNAYSVTASYSENTINQSVIDANGLLFLPVTGFRNNAQKVINSISNGYYWSKEVNSSTSPWRCGLVSFADSGLSVSGLDRQFGAAVRLASEVN